MHHKSPFPPLPPVPDQNVHDFMFSSPALTDPQDKLLLIDPLNGKKWWRDEFKERVYDCATALVTPVTEGGLGFSPEGEMVGIMSTNCLEYITVVHSLLRVAIPFSLIPSGATAFELDHLFRTSEATRLFVHPTLLPQALEAAQKLGLPDDRVYILEGRVQGRVTLADAIHEVRKRNVPRVPSKPVKRDTLGYLVFSSGTSGLPKAVMVSQRNVIVSMIQAAVVATLDAPKPILETYPPVTLGFLPIYHSYGLHFVALRTVWQTIPVVLIPRWNIDLVLDLIPKYRISILTMTPPAILQFVNHKRIKEVDLSSLVTTGSGAAHLPQKLAKAYSSLFKHVESVTEGYGMSECTISATRAAPPQYGGLKPGSVGLLLPGVEARIVRDDGTLAGYNEPGELWLKGENIALGYWRNEKATKETFGDGWLRTGDRFRIDEDGNLYFVERSKDVLKVSGTQVSPTEIENALLAYPERLISDVAVAGVTGGRTKDEKVPRAWVVLSEEGRTKGERAVVEELHAWVQKNLSKFKWLRGGIEIVDEIPKNPTGKVLRRVLQERYEQQLKAQQAPQAKL
ncbi:acetyl-CoA synthetase-like protein [Lentinus tigrinus ALCF2SS1-7]|uniref:Acetyl-CoA synthetase-like protein n=1 Tax=Lentinus tigrinus ALCF2SS1-6 TaxID=1328759 RepID=A0A5C2SF45_9APHY|nr:acetyl-CoA synthetase-like protein [Lentinus tigrinus ALCF2SS1-6]RPD77777.1 acetyl-CoA synthetase-like protein [Lentinus tigrinus ALCF2SS1-7]